MTLREQYQKDTGKSSHLLKLNDGELVTTHYVEWLEQQIFDKDLLLDAYSAQAKAIEELVRLREEAAWNAALKWDSNNEANYYHDIEEWRNSR